jgi:hypothetical protein
MPFNQSKLAKSVDQTQDIFDKYVYKTEDSLAEVTSSGYFSQSRFSGTEGWAEGYIDAMTADGYAFLQISRDGNSAMAVSSGGGSSTFLDLSDTPSSYAGFSGQVAAVNEAEDGLEFLDNGGAVSSLIGVSVYLETLFEVVNSISTWTTIDWGAAQFDPLGMQVDGQTFRVPDGWSHAVIRANARFGANANGDRQLRVLKDGLITYPGNVWAAVRAADSALTTVQAGSAIIPVTAGEDFTVEAIQNSGNNMNLQIGSTWMQISLINLA